MWDKDREKHLQRQREYMRNYPAEKKAEANAKRRARRKSPEGERVRALQMESYYRRRDKVLQDNKEKYKARLPHMRAMSRKSKYGISVKEYEAMMESQDGCCAICGERRRLGVDHNHKTKAVRSLLCSPCNTAIGLFKEDTRRMRAAIEYLERANSRLVLLPVEVTDLRPGAINWLPA